MKEDTTRGRNRVRDESDPCDAWLNMKRAEKFARGQKEWSENYGKIKWKSKEEWEQIKKEREEKKQSEAKEKAEQQKKFAFNFLKKQQDRYFSEDTIDMEL